MKIKKEQKEKIASAVKASEANTSGEIVPVFLKKSDFYPAAHFRCAIVASFLLSLLLYYSWIRIEDPIYFIWIQIPGLLLGHLLAYHSKVKRFFTTKKEMREEVRQRAVEAFFTHQLHTTRDRTGILIMVSWLERRIEVLADSGINEKVEQKVWDEIVEHFGKKLGANELVEGFCEAITSCGRILAVHFPIKDDDTNELSNGLVTE